MTNYPSLSEQLNLGGEPLVQQRLFVLSIAKENALRVLPEDATLNSAQEELDQTAAEIIRLADYRERQRQMIDPGYELVAREHRIAEERARRQVAEAFKNYPTLTAEELYPDAA